MKDSEFSGPGPDEIGEDTELQHSIVDQVLKAAEDGRVLLPRALGGEPPDLSQRRSFEELIEIACRYIHEMDEQQFDRLVKLFSDGINASLDSEEQREQSVSLCFAYLDQIYSAAGQFAHYQKFFLDLLKKLYPREPDAKHYLERSEEIETKFGALFMHYYAGAGKKDFLKGLHASFPDDIAFYIDNIDASLAGDFAENFCFALDDYRTTDRSHTFLMEYFSCGLLGALANSGDPKIDKAMDEFLCRQYGLDWQGLKKSWSTTYARYGRSGFVEKNLVAIEALEDEETGMCRCLHEEFGIEFFARYPTELLVNQYLERGQDVPYGIILYPKSDWNGAFYDADRRVFENFTKPWHMSDFKTRVVEAGGKYSVAKRLLSLDRRYGAENKISFAIVGGHGTRESIIFGCERSVTNIDANDDTLWRRISSAHILKIDDLLGRGVQKLGGIFADHPVFVLSSCSTGQAQGIGAMISEIYNATLTAPNRPTAIRSLKPKVEGSKIIFKVEYFERGAIREYQSGVGLSDPQISVPIFDCYFLKVR